MTIIAYDYTGVPATYTVPYGRTVDQHMYVHFLHKILRFNIQQKCSHMLS